MMKAIPAYPMKQQVKKQVLRVVKKLTVFLIVLACVGCSSNPETTLEPTQTVTLAPLPSISVTEIATATETITPTTQPTSINPSETRTSYQFMVDLDYNKHHLDVQQTIHYQNQTGEALTEIKLVVPPNAKSNVFSLNLLEISGDVRLKSYNLDGITLQIEFESPLPINGSLDIALGYTLDPRLQGGILGYSVKQLNLSDWYPFIPSYDAENGWIIHQPAEVGEYLVYEDADFDLTLNMVNSTGLVVAGSAEVAPLDLGRYRMVQENSGNITFSVSDQYTILTNTAGGFTVRGYVFKGDETSGQASVDATANALQLYSELFGVAYPHQTLSVVESDFPDGMEYDGLYYLSDSYFKHYDGTPQNYLTLLSVHETSHQWWFGVVGNDQALEPWLDESLATYSEFLYIERYYPDLANWWWDYRVAYYKPAGRVNMTIYDQSDLRTYINAVYLQGASFLDQLRQTIGDDAFFAGLKRYTNTYNHQVATWDDFLKQLSPEPSDLVDTLIREYFK